MKKMIEFGIVGLMFLLVLGFSFSTDNINQIYQWDEKNITSNTTIEIIHYYNVWVNGTYYDKFNNQTINCSGCWVNHSNIETQTCQYGINPETKSCYHSQTTSILIVVGIIILGMGAVGYIIKKM